MTTPAPSAEARSPERAVIVTITIGGDSDADVIGAIRGIAHDYWDREMVGSCVSGSPSCGYTITVRRNPEMTHERYFEEVDAWLERTRAPRPGEERGNA